ncbi:DUF1778 domain-containing protein [Paenarthrobacter ilicis]|uniref:type II toxin-antitoxin system TacA family antitoxin n=1 Tax=Paenarthrobacter ilicis TaxID=43665 RepID=UPI00300A9134
MSMTKTRRLELRTDETTDQLISEAAELLHVSKTAFITDAARQAAERVVARADTTLMAPEIFDAMMASLDVPDESSKLETLSMLPRHIRR